MDFIDLVYKVFYGGLSPKAPFDPVTRQRMNFSTANGRWLLVVRKQNEMEFKLPPMTNDVMQFKQGNGFYLVDNTSSYSYRE